MKRALLFALAVGCSDAGRSGVVEVSISGESLVERGIGAEHFADGWSVSFKSFVVTLRDVRVGLESSSFEPSFDLVKGTQSVLTFSDVEVGRYDLGFTIASVSVAGVARRAGVEKEFLWRYPEPTVYARCQRDGVGVVVRDNAATRVEITVHGDHLFREGASHEDTLRFAAFAAADANADGAITRAELDAVGLDAVLAARVRGLGHFAGEGECVASRE